MTKQADNGVSFAPSIEAGVVNALQEGCHRTATEHGFKGDWYLADFLEEIADKSEDGRRDLEDDEIVKLRDAAIALRNNIIGMKLALIHSEISEALESLRKNAGVPGALEGFGNFGEELADAIVRILDTGSYTKDNLGDALLHKMAVNEERPFMHGNKAM